MRIDEYFEIIRLPEFNKDMKKLLKRYRTLEEDLDNFLKNQVYLNHILKKKVKGVFSISGLGIDEAQIFKSKKFSCRSLFGTGSYSGIRVVYAYESREENRDIVTLIEIYFKADKENEDRERIYKYFG